MMKPLVLLALATLTGAASAGTEPTAASAPITTSAPASDWWFRTDVYGWLTAVDGDVGVGHLSSSVDISMADTLESVDMTYMGILEAGYGKWSLGLDVVYAKLSQDIGGGGILFDSFRFEQKQWLLTPILAYRAVETERYQMSVFAGARFTLLEVELTGRLAHGGEVSATRDTDWADPIVGVRGQWGLSDNLFFRYYGDIGGFGVNSDLTWQVFAGLGYDFTQSVSAAVGYRALGVDYSEGPLSMDLVTHGPVLGLEVRF